MKSEQQGKSNIAIVKYWGKKGFQLPANPSISFTLDNIYTQTEFALKERSNNDAFEINFFFENKPKPEFLPKILAFFKSINPYFSWLQHYCLEIHSYNNFPFGTGIASSASSMSALAKCIMDLDQQIKGEPLSNEFLMQRVSYYSRIGSGSACRSVYNGFSEWGKHPDIVGSSDEYAIGLTNIHPDFMQIRDAVLLIETSEKSVSSSKGHDMLNEHWYANRRFEQGFENTKLLYRALQDGDINHFGQIAEQEALTLHAMMLTSTEGYFLINPNTLNVLNAIRQFRIRQGIQAFFTMDAGANVHLLYFEKDKSAIKSFINKELLQYCSNKEYIDSPIAK
ncbi:MAG: diphosphomevalonate decarboxylase [Bacteroidetes bacterium]|nr:diphosphomevalonate decarboxylase [Bacteroidota bacterium]